MSTQDEDGVPFEIAEDLHGLRLLELPPSLLDLIRSGNSSHLTLKSAAAPEGGGRQDKAHAVLCTQGETYQVRQVQSSNSVFVLQPNQTPVSSDGIQMPVTSLRAIAKCPNMLELVPTKPRAVAVLKETLPVYEVEQLDGMNNNGGLNPDEGRSKVEALNDAPFSAGEFQEAWTEICAFENKDAAWIPSTGLLVKGWEIILAAATIRGLNLHDTFSTNAIKSTAAEEGFPLPLIEAILARVSAGNQGLMDGYASLDRIRSVSWVGATLLEALGGEIAVSEFLDRWQDRIPETWRSQATLDKLEGSFRRTANERITYDEKASDPKVTAEDSTRSTGKTKPNWHERFRNTAK